MCGGFASPELQRAYWDSRSSPKTERMRMKAEAREKQRELDRLADQRRALAASQQAQMATLQEQAAARAVEQQQQVTALRQEQQGRLAEIKTQTEEKTKRIGMLSSAVSSGLTALSANRGIQAPTAAVAPKRRQQQGARSTTASLRMGSTSRSAGSGANLSI